MAALYCFGIPFATWCSLYSKKREIQKLQGLLEDLSKLEKTPDEKSLEIASVKNKLSVLNKDPILTGLSPLYKDYEASKWWFEVPKFVSTLLLCGVTTLIPAEGASQVFFALITSIGMMMLFANHNPYVNKSDDALAQFCQLSLTFTISIGLLEKASETFQVCCLFKFRLDQNPSVHVLIICCIIVCCLLSRTLCLGHF